MIVDAAVVLTVAREERHDDARSLLPATLLEHPVYDCLYVALARSMDDLLWTADGTLARVVRRHGVARVALLGE